MDKRGDRSNFALGSNPEVQREPRNVGSWGISGSRFRAPGLPILAKTVYLDKTGKVIGDIAHENLTIEAGGHFEGWAQPLESVDPGRVAKLARA